MSEATPKMPDTSEMLEELIDSFIMHRERDSKYNCDPVLLNSVRTRMANLEAEHAAVTQYLSQLDIEGEACLVELRAAHDKVNQEK